jgi:iron complex outermembrane recepter protein
MAGSNKKFTAQGSRELAAAISAVLAVGGAAHAQTTAPATPTQAAADEGGLDVVIVTATRRAEALQNVAESISAVTTDDIAIRGITNMDDVARIVPGLTIVDRQPAATSIVFRGVANSGLSYGSVSSSGLYLDEQPITQSGRSPDPRFIDIERVEALRGPQGTLYGASSQSGTLRVITNKPDTSKFEGWVDLTGAGTRGGDGSHDASAMLNIPLVDDKLALRVVAFSAEDGGYIDNVLTDSPEGTFDNADIAAQDVNKIKTSGARTSLRWEIGEGTSLTLGALFQDLKADGTGEIGGDVNSTRESVENLEQVRFEQERLDDSWYQYGVTLNTGLPFADVVVSGSYFERDFRYELDATAYEHSFNETGGVAYDFGGDPRGYATNHERTEITTVEARLSSKTDAASRWSWLVGAFYSKEEGHTEFGSFARGYGDSPSFEYYNQYEQDYLSGEPLTPTDQWFSGLYDTELKQKAVFGEVSFNITDNFSVTAGGRWFDYERFAAQHQEQPPGFTGPTLLDNQRESSEDGTVFKVGASWQLDPDHLLYGTYSEGFRVGGGNILKPNSGLPASYESDTLRSFEIGSKNEWLGRRLRLNVSAYHMIWDDFAVQIEDPQDGVFNLGFVNLPKAEITGVEVEFAYAPSDVWTIDASLGWNDAKTSEAVTFTVIDEDDNQYDFNVPKGSRLPLSSEWSGSLGLEARPQTTLFGGQPFVRLDYSFVGSSVNSLEGIESVVTSRPPELQHAYQLGNFRIGVDGEKWSAAVFVDNIFDQQAELFISNRWIEPRISTNRPRSYGLNVRFKF